LTANPAKYETKPNSQIADRNAARKVALRKYETNPKSKTAKRGLMYQLRPEKNETKPNSQIAQCMRVQNCTLKNTKRTQIGAASRAT
jgi:hypothetical protein